MQYSFSVCWCCHELLEWPLFDFLAFDAPHSCSSLFLATHGWELFCGSNTRMYINKMLCTAHRLQGKHYKDTHHLLLQYTKTMLHPNEVFNESTSCLLSSIFLGSHFLRTCKPPQENSPGLLCWVIYHPCIIHLFARNWDKFRRDLIKRKFQANPEVLDDKFEARASTKDPGSMSENDRSSSPPSSSSCRTTGVTSDNLLDLDLDCWAGKIYNLQVRKKFTVHGFVRC